jgi:hypothetical protein
MPAEIRFKKGLGAIFVSYKGKSAPNWLEQCTVKKIAPR